MKLISKILLLSLIIVIIMCDINIVFAENTTSEIVMDQNSKRVLFCKNEHNKMPMASTTKILTCITIIENFDTEKIVEIKKEYTNIEGSSIYLKEGESFQVIELLYGLMLRSGNDCAVALAISQSGSIENFAKLMNSTAKNIGAKESYFVNPHGLHDDNHYTTAYDLALITSYALNNELFKKIVSTKEIVIGSGESKRLLINKNKMLKNYKYATGVKTGYTKKAGRCLVSSANKNGFQLVSVVLNCPPMYERSEELLDEAYEKFINYKVCSRNKCVGTLNLLNGKVIPVYTRNDVYYPLTIDEVKKVKNIVKFNKKTKIPLNFNEECGTIEFYLEKQLLFTEKIYTII